MQTKCMHYQDQLDRGFWRNASGDYEYVGTMNIGRLINLIKYLLLRVPTPVVQTQMVLRTAVTLVKTAPFQEVLHKKWMNGAYYSLYTARVNDTIVIQDRSMQAVKGAITRMNRELGLQRQYHYKPYQLNSVAGYRIH